MDKYQFGRKIRIRRKELDITAEDLAVKLNRVEKTVRAIESGQRSTSLDNFVQICNILKIKPEVLLSSDLDNELIGYDEKFAAILKSLDGLNEKELGLIKHLADYLKLNR